MDNSSFESSFVKFSKHIPRILRKQLLADVTNQLLASQCKPQQSEVAETPTLSSSTICCSLKNWVDIPVHIYPTNLISPPPLSAKYDPKSSCRPTIERFHGTLLFVDISGFTILSQKLTPDRLRSFINAYFKRLIDIVQKYDGEVIKFAGDALFIIWQTKVNSLGKLG